MKIRVATKLGYQEWEPGMIADLSFPDSKYRRARIQGGGNIAPTLQCEGEKLYFMETEYRIRKLTPRECWRLMGFTDEDFDKAEKVVSNSQLYKQAGNSIVCNVLCAIFKEML